MAKNIMNPANFLNLPGNVHLQTRIQRFKTKKKLKKQW
jgi:hypothetical protein